MSPELLKELRGEPKASTLPPLFTDEQAPKFRLRKMDAIPLAYAVIAAANFAVGNVALGAIVASEAVAIAALVRAGD